MSVSPVLTACSDASLRRQRHKILGEGIDRPWAYTEPSWIVAALVKPSSLKTNSAATRPCTLSLWAVRKKLGVRLAGSVRSGSCVGAGDHRDARIVQDGSASRPRFAGAGRADDGKQAGIGSQLGRRSLAAFGRAAGVFADDFNRVAENFAAQIAHGDLDAAHHVRAQ